VLYDTIDVYNVTSVETDATTSIVTYPKAINGTEDITRASYMLYDNPNDW
jgi:hypothetical protein